MSWLQNWLLPLALIIVIMMPYSGEAIGTNNQKMIIKTKTFLSPPFPLTPGLVAEKFYYNINFPKGHIAIKSFNIEVVDESGNEIPLSQTYLHHWALLRYYQHKNAPNPNTSTSYSQLQEPNFIIASNNGVCQPGSLPPYYAMGSESRKISTFLPNPYGIEVGNVGEVPLGYEEKWSLNVHAIDIRGAEDKLGCMECYCDLYNVTKDRYGRPLKSDYKGGLECCYDQTQCRVGKSYEGKQRNLYLRYTVKWVDWDDDLVIPVKVYIFDVTDSWTSSTDSTTGQLSQQHRCLVEYNVESCSVTDKLNNGDECTAVKKLKVIFPESGFVVYGVAHQHIGGIGATFHGEDGRVLCSSRPIYGRSGNEEGYVVGMTTCYPKPAGSVKINNGEMVSLISKYDSTHNHTGVMGLFQIIIAHKILINPSLGNNINGSSAARKVVEKTVVM